MTGMEDTGIGSWRWKEAVVTNGALAGFHITPGKWQSENNPTIGPKQNLFKWDILNEVKNSSRNVCFLQILSS